MIIKVSGIPALSIAGSTYTAEVPVATYDDAGWQGEGSVLTVTGALNDTGAQFMTKLTAASNAWASSLATRDTFLAKLANLVGRTV